MNRTLLSVAAATLISTLAACGGGGSSDGSTTPPAGSMPPVVVAPPVINTSVDVVSATGTLNATPAASTYAAGSLQASAYAAINVARSGAGAGAMNQAATLDVSAMAHATYQLTNIAGGLTHFEDATKVDFYAVSPADRMAKAGHAVGYTNETISGTSTTGADYVYGLLDTVYHGAALLSQANDIGFAFKMDPNFTSQSLGVANLASGAGYGQVPAAGALVAYPFNGQAGVFETFYAGNEVPRVSTTLFPNATAGTPVIVNVRNADYVNFSAAGTLKAVVTQFVLKDGSGNIVPSTIIGNSVITGATGVTVNADTNLGEGVVVLVPTSPLLKGQVYTYTFSATLKTGATVTTKTAQFTTNP